MKSIVLALLLNAAVPALAATNLVTNGSFTSGNFSGWTQFGSTENDFVADKGYTGFYEFPGDGANAELGAMGGAGGIYQDIPTIAGQTYRVSFQLGGAWGQYFNVDFGNTRIASFGDVWQDFQGYSGIAVATGTTTRLSFTNRNDDDYYVLDRVAVSAGVPEPTVWACLVAGFAMTGIGIRHRRHRAA